MKLKSNPLMPGDLIGVIAPASPVHQGEELAKAINNLESLGFRTLLGAAAMISQGGFLAGSDQARLEELMDLWTDPQVKGIWALRGGYGTLRLLGQLDYQMIARVPKPLIGFSDITALELALWSKLSLVSFHGPVLTKLTSEFSRNQGYQMLSGKFMPGMELPWNSKENLARLVVFKPGRAGGVLLGGNLVTLVSLIGTEYLPELQGAILFLEEVEEAGYRIDRLLSQLLLSGVIDRVSAILIGQCVPVAGETEKHLQKIFWERLSGLGCPVAYGFPIGHLLEQWTLPQGVLVEVDLERGAICLLESPWDLM